MCCYRRRVAVTMLRNLIIFVACCFAFGCGTFSFAQNGDDHNIGSHELKHQRECNDRDRHDRDTERRMHDDDDDCECLRESAEGFSVEAPGVSQQGPSTLLSAFALANTGVVTKKDVRVTSINLAGGTLTVPALPIRLGTLIAGRSVIVDADFLGGPFLPNSSYPLVVRGRYSVRHVTHCFKVKAQLSVPPAGPGSAPVRTTNAESNMVAGAPFHHRPPEFDEEEVNFPGWTVPTGPFVPAVPTQMATFPQRAPIGDPPAI